MRPVLHTLRGAALLLSLTLPQLVFSQQRALDESRKRIESDPRVKDFRFDEQRQSPSMIVLKPQQGVKRGEAQAALAQYLGVRSGVDALQPTRTVAARGSFEVIEFAQYYQGVKVDRAGFKALLRDGLVTFFNGSWYSVPQGLSLQPGLARDAALERAKKISGGRTFAWEAVEERLRRSSDSRERAALEAELAAVQPGGELVIVNDFSASGKAQPRLAWKFNVYAAEPLFRAWIYIDAQDAHTLLVDKIIKHIGEEGGTPNPPASVSATVQTRYAGTQVIKTKQISGNDPNSGYPLLSSHPLSEPLYLPGGATYALMDDTRGGGIETYDLNGLGGLPISVPGLYLQGKSLTDQDNNWTLAEHKRSGSNQDGAFEAENDDIAWDAHWGAEVVYDYWLAKHNRLSYDGNNAKIKSFIHYGPAYDNAFWNGSAMTYGDGSGPTATGFKALTSLDVCGHEIGHGVCSFTSDLVYAAESGAMNEALSDIWASCIEHFAMVRPGSTVPTGAYRPFYIGEQIGANADAPLRRMDNPKAQRNPDTYGGDNWVNPVCTPTLANDECGVHTNSGVLNHWFFLLTAGSLNGTRPAGLNADWYYRADSDDELNDLGNSYHVNGVGFDQSEQVAFLMETMLSSTATYAEARAASIEAATSLTNDPCSALVESVTNAWYAVGVGEAFVRPCSVTYGFVTKNGVSLLEAGDTHGCGATRSYEVAVLLPAGGTATLSRSGTASEGTDYTVNATSLTNSTTGIARKNFVISIKNDGVVETDETIQLSIAVTNAGSAPVNNTFVLTIIDDDVTPIIGEGQRSLLTESFTGADGFDDPAGWTEVLEVPEGAADPLAAGKNQWGIFSNKLAITGTEGLTGTAFPGGTYNSNSESQTLIKSPLLDSRGLSQLQIRFDYAVQGEVDVQNADPASLETAPVFDYMAVAYSLDGVNFVELNTGDFHPFASVQPASGTFSANLPPNLANKQFYLAFRWRNDGNGGGPNSVTVDNLAITGSPRRIENEANQPGRETLSAGQDVYFYSQADGDLILRAANRSTKEYGCTNTYVERAGSGTFNLYQSGGSLVKVADKVVRIESATTYRAANTVTLYFTEEQLQNLEQATGLSRSTFKVYLVSAASYLQAAGNNSNAYIPTYTALPGVGGAFTISFSNYIVGSYALGAPVSTFLRTESVTREEANAAAAGWSFAPLFPNPGRGATTLDITAPDAARVQVAVVNGIGQVVRVQYVGLQKGLNRVRVDLGKATGGNYRVLVRNAEGGLLNSQSLMKQ